MPIAQRAQFLAGAAVLIPGERTPRLLSTAPAIAIAVTVALLERAAGLFRRAHGALGAGAAAPVTIAVALVERAR